MRQLVPRNCFYQLAQERPGSGPGASPGRGRAFESPPAHHEIWLHARGGAPVASVRLCPGLFDRTRSLVSGVSCNSRTSTVIRSNTKFKSARVGHSASNSQLGFSSILPAILRVRVVSSANNTTLSTLSLSFPGCLLPIVARLEAPSPNRAAQSSSRRELCSVLGVDVSTNRMRQPARGPVSVCTPTFEKSFPQDSRGESRAAGTSAPFSAGILPRGTAASPRLKSGFIGIPLRNSWMQT